MEIPTSCSRSHRKIFTISRKTTGRPFSLLSASGFSRGKHPLGGYAKTEQCSVIITTTMFLLYMISHVRRSIQQP